MVRRAFALVDAIVAAVILGMALAAILGMSASAVSAQTRGEQMQIASMLADEQLEQVLAVGCERYGRTFDERGACPAPFGGYRYEIEIDGGAAGDPYAVRVTIRWPHAGRERSLAIQTLVAPRLGDEPDPDRKPEEPMGRDA
ncbi:MAG: type II secretion system protein [Phycisphaerales bacterium]|nr:type II secretion system protein [Phycisphaerales bacterium]